MKLIFDLETNGLVKEVTTVHMIVCQDVDTEEVHTFINDGEGVNQIEDGLKLLDKADELIGHNILDFDFPVLEKLYKWKSKSNLKVSDTLVLCKLSDPDVQNTDFRKKIDDMPIKLYGSHSLEAWGWRIGERKNNKPFDWMKFTPEMLTYCIQDVKTNLKLYTYLCNLDLAPLAVQLEISAAATATRMEHNGFTFDMKSAGMLQADLASQREEIHKALRDVFPTRVIERYSEKTGKRLKDEVIEFNPGSRDHIAYWLKTKYDWKPKVFTNGGKPMIDEEILEGMDYPEAKKLVGYFMLEKRLGMLSEGKNAWMALSQADGRVHGRMNTIGAATGRCTHSNPNMAQVPSVRKPYGKECRQLFTVPKGFKLVGTDLSGIELRCLAHYLASYDNGDYAKEIIEGDIHTRTQEAAGLPTRDAAKTFTYALLYGAGDAKMGLIVGGGRKEGKEMKEKFFTALPAFKKLSEKVAEASERGWLKGLDGRRLPVRSPHAALNTLLQGAAAQIAKLWFVRYEENCMKEGWKIGEDFWLSAFVHDEIQVTVREEFAERCAQIAVESAYQAGEELGMRCKVGAEAKIGMNWYDCH